MPPPAARRSAAADGSRAAAGGSRRADAAGSRRPSPQPRVSGLCPRSPARSRQFVPLRDPQPSDTRPSTRARRSACGRAARRSPAAHTHEPSCATPRSTSNRRTARAQDWGHSSLLWNAGARPVRAPSPPGARRERAPNSNALPPVHPLASLADGCQLVTSRRGTWPRSSDHISAMLTLRVRHDTT